MGTSAELMAELYPDSLRVLLKMMVMDVRMEEIIKRRILVAYHKGMADGLNQAIGIVREGADVLRNG